MKRKKIQSKRTAEEKAGGTPHWPQERASMRVACMFMRVEREIVSTKGYSELQLGSPWPWYMFIVICKVVYKYMRDHLKLNAQLNGDKYLPSRGFIWALGRAWWEATARILAPCPIIAQGAMRRQKESWLSQSWKWEFKFCLYYSSLLHSTF